MSDLYRKATTDELIAWTRGGCSDDSVQVIDAVRVDTELDALAAAVGYGIDLQEACDIIDLAVEGRSGLTEFKRTLYDKVSDE